MKLKVIFKWVAVCLVTSVLAGFIGSAFAHLVTLVTNLRIQNGYLVLGLPLGGILTVLLYKALKTQGLGTNQVLRILNGEKPVSPWLTVSVFSSAVLTHLFGGSAGREGAALQMGGSTAVPVSRLFKLNAEETKIAVICGMSAFFSALFGTPLGAAIFATEVVFSKKRTFKALLPSLLSGYTAFIISIGLLCHPERFTLAIPKFCLSFLWQSVLLIILSSAVCILFVLSLHNGEKFFKKLFKNDYLKIVAGSLIIIALTALVGNQDYNGGGMNIVEKIFAHSEVKYEAFLLKILFTAITVAAGFKGGEIVPTFFIGATFGGAVAVALGMPLPFGAALGMAALFSGATNCPIATVFLCCEMFGFKGILYYITASFISYFITGKKRLYSV